MRKRLTEAVRESIRVDREENGLALGAIMQRYGLSRSTAYAAIAGLDDSKVVRASPAPRLAAIVRPPRPPLSKANLGEAARQVMAARMMMAGLTVFAPIGEDTPVDLLVLRSDGAALKCQCKCMFVDANGAHIMPLCAIRKWGPNAKAVPHRYRADEVDFFLGYAHETDSTFVLPYEAMRRYKTRVSMWLLRQPVGRNGTPPFDPRPYKDAFHLLDPAAEPLAPDAATVQSGAQPVP
jgi:hypothetical protein